MIARLRKAYGYGCPVQDEHPGTGGNGDASLVTMRSGSKAEVSGIRAGCKARSRLASLGLMPGSILQVIANPGVGPLLLSVGDSRIMVERGVASKVQVQAI